MRDFPMGVLASSLATQTTEVTPDETVGVFIPRRCLPCHGEANQRTKFEKACRACRLALDEEARRFAFKSKELGRAAEAFLKSKGVRMNRKGDVRSAWTPPLGEEAEVGEFNMGSRFPGYKR